jgi:hypothetical protein
MFLFRILPSLLKVHSATVSPTGNRKICAWETGTNVCLKHLPFDESTVIFFDSLTMFWTLHCSKRHNCVRNETQYHKLLFKPYFFLLYLLVAKHCSYMGSRYFKNKLSELWSQWTYFNEQNTVWNGDYCGAIQRCNSPMKTSDPEPVYIPVLSSECIQNVHVLIS